MSCCAICIFSQADTFSPPLALIYGYCSPDEFATAVKAGQFDLAVLNGEFDREEFRKSHAGIKKYAAGAIDYLKATGFELGLDLFKIDEEVLSYEDLETEFKMISSPKLSKSVEQAALKYLVGYLNSG
ncbi:MAG: hypothetical protein AAF907_01465, partial [Planctomycetota bacterium]